MRKPHVWELSKLFPELSTKLYVHELCFSIFFRLPEAVYKLICQPIFLSRDRGEPAWRVGALSDDRSTICRPLQCKHRIRQICLHKKRSNITRSVRSFFYVVDVSQLENPGVRCAKSLRKLTRQKSARYRLLTCCKEGLVLRFFLST